MIDFHCHLDLFQNPEAVLDGIDQHGTYVLAVTTTPKAWSGTNKLVRNTKRVKVALGLHPEIVSQRFQELPLLLSLLTETRYVGEIGIDGSVQHRNSLDLQKSVFESILLECSKLGGRIMSIHSRRSASIVLDVLERNPAAGTPVLHWFSGSMRELNRAIDMGCWFSIGPAMMQSRKGQELAAAMPIDRLLTETDAPFTRNGKLPLMPWQASDALKHLKIGNMTRKELSFQVKANFKRILL